MLSKQKYQIYFIGVVAAYLINTKEELISERNFMESNWNNSMIERMKQISMQSIILFNLPISKL